MEAGRFKLRTAVRRPSWWIVVPIALALLAFYQGPLWWLIAESRFGGGMVPTSDTVTLSIWLGWLWIGTFVTALYFWRWRALWLLLAAPFALYWPAMWIFVAHACDLLGSVDKVWKPEFCGREA